MDAPIGSAADDALETLSIGDTPGISGVIIDGELVVRASINTPRKAPAGGRFMNRFAGKVALVTGGGGALGRASALRFVEEGARVVIADSDLDRAQAVAAELGSDAIAVHADVTKPDDCIAMVEAARGSFGKLDVVFANAGVGGEKTEFVHMPMEEWDRVMGINLRGMVLTCKAAARLN